MEYRYRDASEMKDSGVEWIGKIPKDWEKCKWGYVTNVLTDYTANGSFGDLAKNVKYLDYKSHARLIRLIDLRQNLDNEGVYVSKSAYDYLGKSSLHGGEFLMANVGANAGFVCEMPSVDYPCTLAPNMMMAKFNENLVNNNFMIYSANSYSIQLQLLSKATQASAQPKLNKEDFKTIIFALPYIKEQEKIANFLDKKTSQFDSIISKKEALIEKLEEAKKSLISEVVTGKVKVVKTDDGYDLVKRSSDEMKDSGVEWLGDIPKDWELSKVKYIFENLDDRRVPLSAEERGKIINGQYDYYGASGVIDRVDSYLFDDELILIGEDGANLYSRNTPLAFIARGKFWVNNHAHILKCRYGNINYLVNLLESIDYTNFITGSAQPKLTQDNLMNIEILNPTLNEQNIIGNYIKEKVINFTNLIVKEKNIIEKLKEAKQSLISEAVTGKIEILD